MQEATKTGLILSRKEGEIIEIHGPSKIVVHKTGNHRVQLRIVADESVPIMRPDCKKGKNK